MSLRSDWPCWEIMKCEPEQAKRCPAYHSSKPCWEAIRELDACWFNICRDCLVYITKQQDSILSKEEILSIMTQKGIDVTRQQRCPGFRVAVDAV